MAKRGRPSKYTAALAAEICQRLSDGEDLFGICKDPHIPGESTVRGWVLDDREGFSAIYARAREIQANKMFEQILAIADEPVASSEDNARNRLRVDTRKWWLSRAMPRVYGEKIDIGLPDGIPKIVFELTHVSDGEHDES